MPTSARKKTPATAFTVPGLKPDEGAEVAGLLQDRLTCLIDLSLTLKHVHWNVVGPHFIAVHEMLDPQVDAVRAMVDQTAERMATLGQAPVGTPQALVNTRRWDDYSLGRADAIAHLGALDLVYVSVIADHRQVMDKLEGLDLVTQDMLIGQIAQLEQFQWFVRAHLENAAGRLANAGADTEVQAANQVTEA